jgi:hypothetical protein
MNSKNEKEELIMACFIVPAAEAAVVKVADVVIKKAGKGSDEKKQKEVNPFVKRLPWLTRLLTGGSVLLAFEHVWHGEVVPWFPFLTAMYNPADKAEMLHEMATVGTSMAVLITVVWGVMCVAADAIVKRAPEKAEAN